MNSLDYVREDPRQSQELERCPLCEDYMQECRVCRDGVGICTCNQHSEAAVLFSIHDGLCMARKAQELAVQVDRYERLLHDFEVSLRRNLNKALMELR